MGKTALQTVFRFNAILVLIFGISISPLSPCSASDIKIETSGQGELSIFDGKELFTKITLTKDGLAKPYIYPILSPNGSAVTRDWPLKTGSANETKDHVHQKSAWFCHGDVIPEGLELKTRSADKHVAGVDFWSEAKGHGFIVVTSHEVQANRVTLKLNWNTPDAVTILKESRIYEFQTVEKGRLISMQTELTTQEYPITFGDTKEGAFGIRVSDSLRMTFKTGDGLLTNSLGKSGMKDIWGYASDWCDYSGTINEKKAGVALFDHPKNKYRSTWHARDYGLLAANPFGRNQSTFPSQAGKTDVVKLSKGESLKLKYAIFAHDGDAKLGKVAEAYQVFSDK
jgi:hypothetical protein